VTTVVDVARQAGVSPATVSRVLNGSDTVSSEARQRVLSAVRDLEYHPNAMARGLRRGRGTTIALLVGDIEQSHFAGLTKHIQVVLEEAGFDLMLHNLGHSEERLRGFLERAAAMRLRAVIIASSDAIPRSMDPLLRALEAAGCLVISVGQNLNRLGLPSVVHEERAAATQSVRHLIAQGRTRIAYVGRMVGSAVGTERFRGYKSALAQAGIAFDPELAFDVWFRFAAGRNAVARALERGIQIDGLQAGSDEIAMGAIAAFQDRNLRVPQDVAVVGFGNVELAAHMRPALTTLSSHPDLAAGHVREILRCAEQGVEVPRLYVVSRSLVRRQSS
jgi:DNA-binding LacI/PurR family transcriptional regulator